MWTHRRATFAIRNHEHCIAKNAHIPEDKMSHSCYMKLRAVWKTRKWERLTFTLKTQYSSFIIDEIVQCWMCARETASCHGGHTIAVIHIIWCVYSYATTITVFDNALFSNHINILSATHGHESLKLFALNVYIRWNSSFPKFSSIYSDSDCEKSRRKN